MSSNNTEVQSPVVLLKENDTYTALNTQETISYIIYRAEEERKKPSFFRRRGERITLISPINYALHVINIGEELFLVVDGNKSGKYVIEYNKPMIEYLEEATEKLNPSEYREFAEKIITINNILENMVKAKAHVVKKVFELENVVADTSLLSELKILLSISLNDKFTGLELKPQSINREAIITTAQEIIELSAIVSKRLEEIAKKIREKHEKWKEEIHTYYAEILHEKEIQRENLKKEVESKIAELKKKQREEIERIRGSYTEKINRIDKQVSTIKENIEKLEEELQKAKEYGKDTKEIKKRLNEEKKRLEKLLKEREKLQQKMKLEIEEIMKKYNELIASQYNRIEQINREIDKINRELESLTRRVNDIISSIETKIHELIDEASNLKKKLVQITIPPPIHGEGVYLITSFITEYKSGDKTRIQLYTPMYIIQSRKLMGQKTRLFQSLNKYLSPLKIVINEERFKDQVIKNNILRQITPERLMNNLMGLSEQYIVDKKKVEKIVKSIEEQIKML